MSLQDHVHKSRIRHVIQRARERYDTELTSEDVKYIEFRMFYTSCPLIRPLCRSGETFLYAVRVKGEWMAFIFDMIDRHAVTVYPKGRLNEYRKLLDELKKRFKEKYANMLDHPLWSEIKKPEIELLSTPDEDWSNKV